MGNKVMQVKRVIQLFFMVMLINVGVNTTEVLASDLAIKPVISYTPEQYTKSETIYPGGNGSKIVEIATPISDKDPESVRGDIKMVVNGQEVILENAYQKPISSFNTTVQAQLPSQYLKPGENDVVISIISSNEDRSKTAESESKTINITKYQRYTVEYRSQRTSDKLNVSGNYYFREEVIGKVGESKENVIIGLSNIDTGVKNEKYSFNEAFLGTTPLKSHGTPDLFHDLVLGDEVDGNTVTLYYELDIPEYFTERVKELNTTFDNKSTNPVIQRELAAVEGGEKYQQKVLFGPINGVKEDGTSYSEKTLLGDGTQANTGKLYLNVLNKFDASIYTMTQGNANKYYDIDSGLSINTGGDTKQNTALYLDPLHTKYYTGVDKDKNDVIKIISVIKPGYDSHNHKEHFVVEFTAVLKQQSNDVDMIAEVTNNTGSDVTLNLMYRLPLQFVGDIRGTTFPVDINQPIKALGKNKGVYIEAQGPSIKTKTTASVVFPDVADNGPENWTVGEYGIDSYVNFNRGDAANTVDGKGYEEGYTETEGLIEGIKAGTPYQEGHILGSKYNTAVQFKSPVKKTKNNTSIKMKWTMSFGDEKLKKPVDSIYRQMDKQTGEKLKDFDIVDRLIPIEVDTKKVDDVTEVKNYLIMGKHTWNDTMTAIKEMKRPIHPLQGSGSLFAPYRLEKVSFSFPRLLTYKKGLMDAQPTSYSYSYDTGGNDYVYGGSGFGIGMFENHKVKNPLPRSPLDPNGPVNLTDATTAEEVYLSKDKKTLKVYGKYEFFDTTIQRNVKIPMKVTMESADDKGKARFILEYMNTLDYETDFRAFYNVHMDINGKHKDSKMKTLGGNKGVYFQQYGDNRNDPIYRREAVKELEGADYYVAFYTHISNDGVAPNDMNVYSFTDETDGNNTDATYPLGWDTQGEDELKNLGRFKSDQARGEEFFNRELGTGKILSNKPKHPGWHFVYPSTTLAIGAVGRADLEMKVTDIPEISYAPVRIESEKNKVINNKADLTIETKLVQDMTVDIKTPTYRPDNFEIVGTYMDYLDNVSESDFDVLKKNGDKLDKSLYMIKLDRGKRKVTVVFRDIALTNLLKETVIIQQRSKIRSDIDSQGVVKYYDKVKGQFVFPIEGFNSWEIHNDTEPREFQDPASKEEQIIKYIPNYEAKPKTDIQVVKGTPAMTPKEYLESVNENYIFDFDEYTYSFKDGKEPEFLVNDDNVPVDIVVESKSFGHPKTIRVNVKVVTKVNMTIKHVLLNKNGTEGRLKNLENLDLPVLPNFSDSVNSVPADSDFSKILKNIKEDKIAGYDYEKAMMTYNGNVVNAETVPKSPDTDFSITVYYQGKIYLDSPDSFDFGKHKLVNYGIGNIKPKIIKDGKDGDDQVKMRVINTQGTGGKWELFVTETKRLSQTKTSGRKIEYKGEIYYIPSIGQTPIVFGKAPVPIQHDNDVENIVNTVPLLSNNLSTKAGVYMTIFAGNKDGVYTDGELTWELRDAR